jgi:FAD:protein FMN transferase
MPVNISRRRMIRISAAAAGLALVPLKRPARSDVACLVTWRGMALGALASMCVHHTGRAEAERSIKRALAEVRRLERIFSLYREDSVLVALNRRGALETPPPELVELLTTCRNYAELTDGAFDPTVQPLWRLFAEHFSRAEADPGGPSQAALDEALDLVGHQHLILDRNRVVFARRGMGLTLNGIAQGYITDRVVDLLGADGIGRSLVDMGETRALGAHPDGRAWTVAITDPQSRSACSEPWRSSTGRWRHRRASPSSLIRTATSITSSIPGPARAPGCIDRRAW